MPTCAQTGLCVRGPDNRLHSSPTSVTSFTDMSPEGIFKGLISDGSDDKAFPLLPPLCPGRAFSLLSCPKSWWPTPALPLGCSQRSPHSCRPQDVQSGTLRMDGSERRSSPHVLLEGGDGVSDGIITWTPGSRTQSTVVSGTRANVPQESGCHSSPYLRAWTTAQRSRRGRGAS